MGKLAVALCLLSGSAMGARQLRGNRRESRNLLGTFPFNAQEGAGEHHGAHDAHHGHHGEGHGRQPVQALEARAQRQGDDTDVSFPAVAAAGPGADGKRFIDKVEMIEETEYDDVVQCDHSYDKRCHTTYVTNYESQQEEECEENYRKSCFIEYETVAFNETVQVCRTPLVKDCDIQGPELCTTQYESECWTKNEEHDVTDDVVECTTVHEEKCEDEASGYTTNTKCSKWPKEVCNVSKKQVKSSHPSQDVLRSQGRCVPPPDVGLKRAERNATTKPRPWSRMPQRKNVHWNPRELANT